MTKPKPKVTKKCVVCGAEFATARLGQKTCAKPECLREYHRRMMRDTYEVRHVQIQRRRAERHYAETSRRTGITTARMAEIAHAQDSGDAALLRASAATWTPAERKWARDRYAGAYGICKVGGFEGRRFTR